MTLTLLLPRKSRRECSAWLRLSRGVLLAETACVTPKQVRFTQVRLGGKPKLLGALTH
jgi:hypothetical protein